jgi:hypothetical protein
MATISPPSGEDLAEEAGTWLNEDGNEPWTGYFNPDPPDGLISGSAFSHWLSKDFRDLHSKKRVDFAFTRCTHRDLALPVSVSC